MAEKQLSPQQWLFVQCYVKHMNATKAAVEAGYSAKNADKIGPRLVGNSRVKAAIHEELQTKKLKNQINADWFVRRLVKIVDFDPGNAVEIKDGVPRLRSDLPKGALKHMDFSGSWSEASGAEGSSSGRSGKAVSKDRLKAMELLMKLMGIGDGAAKDSGRDQDIVDQRVLDALQRHKGKART